MANGVSKEAKTRESFSSKVTLVKSGRKAYKSEGRNATDTPVPGGKGFTGERGQKFDEE